MEQTTSSGLTVTNQNKGKPEQFSSITYVNLMKGSKQEAERYLAKFNKPKEKDVELVKGMIPDAIKTEENEQISEKTNETVIPSVETNSETLIKNESNINIQQDEKINNPESQIEEDELKGITITIEDKKELRRLYNEVTGSKPSNFMTDRQLIDAINKAQK